MWIVIMGCLIAAFVAGSIYLVSRVRKFAFVKKLAGEKKSRQILLSALLVAAETAVIWICLGSMNAIVCQIHLMIFWLLCELIFFIIRKARKKGFQRYYTGAAACIFTVGYLAVGWVLVHHVWQTDYVIKTEKAVGNLRLAVLADSHVGTTFHGEGFEKRLEKLQAQEPDAVLVVGDFVDDDTSREDMIRSCQALGKLEATYGVYYVFGNHDKGYYPAENRGYTGDDLVKELEENGVTVLQDETVLLGDDFYLCGRKDRSEETENREGSTGRKQMDELTENLDPDKFSIVMDHQPCDYDAQADAQVDLVLSGHTHGGQLFPLGLVSTLTGLGGNDQVYGYEKRGETNFIVTSGISDWAIKFKTGCKSEFVIVDIQGK